MDRSGAVVLEESQSDDVIREGRVEGLGNIMSVCWFLSLSLFLFVADELLLVLTESDFPETVS